jgi:hypothetical protein
MSLDHTRDPSTGFDLDLPVGDRAGNVTAAAPDAWDSPETEAARIAQARALREQAGEAFTAVGEALNIP